MNPKTNTLRTLAATLVITGGAWALAPALAADAPQGSGSYVTDGNGNPISDSADNCVGDASLAEGKAGKCGGSAPATSVAEPKKSAPASEA